MLHTHLQLAVGPSLARLDVQEQTDHIIGPEPTWLFSLDVLKSVFVCGYQSNPTRAGGSVVKLAI